MSPDFNDVLTMLYGLSWVERQTLETILKEGKPITASELSETLKVDKAVISRALNNLLRKGLIKRTRIKEKDKRSLFAYYVDDKEFKNKVWEDTERFLESIKTSVQSYLNNT